MDRGRSSPCGLIKPGLASRRPDGSISKRSVRLVCSPAGSDGVSGGHGRWRENEYTLRAEPARPEAVPSPLGVAVLELDRLKFGEDCADENVCFEAEHKAIGIVGEPNGRLA